MRMKRGQCSQTSHCSSMLCSSPERAGRAPGAGFRAGLLQTLCMSPVHCDAMVAYTGMWSHVMNRCTAHHCYSVMEVGVAKWPGREVERTNSEKIPCAASQPGRRFCFNWHAHDRRIYCEQAEAVSWAYDVTGWILRATFLDVLFDPDTAIGNPSRCLSPLAGNIAALLISHTMSFGTQSL